MNKLDEINVLWLKRWAGTLTEEEGVVLDEHSHRHPKTQQERKNSVSVDGDEPKVRAKRNKRNLPTNWDDMSPERQRSWKKYRKTQFKESVLWLKKYAGILTEEESMRMQSSSGVSLGSFDPSMVSSFSGWEVDNSGAVSTLELKSGVSIHVSLDVSLENNLAGYVYGYDASLYMSIETDEDEFEFESANFSIEADVDVESEHIGGIGSGGSDWEDDRYTGKVTVEQIRIPDINEVLNGLQLIGTVPGGDNLLNFAKQVLATVLAKLK